MYTVNKLDNGTWLDAEEHCERDNAYLWTPNGHAEWWNIYSRLMSSNWKNGTELNIAAHSMFISSILFIGMQVLEKHVSMSILITRFNARSQLNQHYM